MTHEIRWRGPKDLKQQKLRWTFTAESDELVVPFEGPLSVALAKQPKAGQQLKGFTDGGLKVVRVEIEELDAGAGRMSVYLGAPKEPDADVSSEPLGEPIYEIDWQELTKPLEQHHKCGKLKADRASVNGKKRTWDDWSDLEASDYEAVGGGWDLATYKAKRAKGIESFSIAFPIIRRTIYYLRTPEGVGADCYEQSTPPAEAGAPSSAGGKALEYMQTTDKLRKEGRLRTRETEWIGAWEFDGDLYPGF